MENENIAELYTHERIKSVEPQPRGDNGAVNNVEWRLDNQIWIVKDDLSDLKGFITILVTIAGFIMSGVTAVVVKFL